MTIEFGASHDLANKIRKHLFVICPNNSGSTWLIRVLGNSTAAWSLKREGQHMLGFAGPRTTDPAYSLLWGSREMWTSRFTAPDAYDWAKIKRAWYFQATAKDASAAVFTTKSPPFLLVVEQLANAFANPGFIFMVRDPYAMIEGICRRRDKTTLPGEDPWALAAKHVVTCLEYQRRNIARFADCSIFFTYEQMCESPLQIEQQISAMVPELNDLDFSQSIAVKGNYDEPLRNMNEQQIARLTPDDLNSINQVLQHHQELLAHFGYLLRSV